MAWARTVAVVVPSPASSLVREVARLGGEYRGLVPKHVAAALEEHRAHLGESLVQAARWSFLGARIATVLPIAVGVSILVIALLVQWRPGIAPRLPRASWAERRAALWRMLDIGILILAVIGGIAMGWVTPSEAAAVGAAGAFLVCIRRRRLSFDTLRRALEDTLKTSGLIYLVIIGALVFSTFISITGLTDVIGLGLRDLGMGPVGTMLLVAVFLLLIGSALDGLALMLLTTPILLPLVTQMGLSPIWFGIFLVRAMEIGFVHPPIGMNLYVIRGVAPDVPLARVFKGVLPFLAADLVHLVLLVLFPVLALGLPAWLS